MISELGIIILAGGLSTRMGTDKTRLPWGSTTLLGEMLRKAVLTECGEIIVSINRDLEESELHILEEARSFGRDIQLVHDRICSRIQRSIYCGICRHALVLIPLVAIVGSSY